MSPRQTYGRTIATVALWGALAFAGMVAFLLVAVASVRRDMVIIPTAERTNASAETVNRATEIRLLAERQMGEFLKGMPKATGAAGHAGPGRGNVVPMANRVSDTPTLAEIGISKKQSATAQKLADIPAASETFALLQSIDYEVSQLAQRTP
ncbi:MAG: hypothetical protein H3C27_01085 [Opitutaceae bacterium]|nr:hypothetical protein [Opitutaceae bacterium]